MGVAKIKSGGPTGLYDIELVQDTAPVAARLVAVNARLLVVAELMPTATAAEATALVNLNVAHAELDAAILHITDPNGPATVKTAQAKVVTTQNTLLEKRRVLAALKLEQTSLEKEKVALTAALVPATREDIWCADLTEDMEVNQVVGTIEVNGETSSMLIMPGGATGLGKLRPSLAMSAAGLFCNLAVFPGWQKWKPTYRVGEIKTVSLATDTCSVCVDEVHSSQQGLAINQAGLICAQDLGNLYTGFANFCAANPTHPIVTNTSNTTITMTAKLRADMIEANNYVNANNPYKKDEEGLDKWNFLSPGAAGDCEDLALTKLQRLLDKGYPISALKIETGQTSQGRGHAWVTVQTTEGDFGLDNNYKNVMQTWQMNYTDRSKQTGPGWERAGVLLSNVPIEYMDGIDASAFAVGDRVVVAFTGQAWTAPKVIGFESNPGGGAVIHWIRPDTTPIMATYGAKSAAVKNADYAPHLTGIARSISMTIQESESYLTYWDYTGQARTSVAEKQSGLPIRSVGTDIFATYDAEIYGGLSPFVYISPPYVDEYNRIWIPAYWLTAWDYRFAGLWCYESDASQAYYQYHYAVRGDPDYSNQTWCRPRTIAIYKADAHWIYAGDGGENGRIKRIRYTTLITEEVHDMPYMEEEGRYYDPFDLCIVDDTLYVLAADTNDIGYQTALLLIYDIDPATGVLALRNTIDLDWYAPEKEHYSARYMQYSGGALYLSISQLTGAEFPGASSIDYVRIYDLDGSFIREMQLPAVPRDGYWEALARIYVG